MMPWLSILLLLPLLGMILTLALPARMAGMLRVVALGTTLLQLVLVAAVVMPAYVGGVADAEGMVLHEKLQWIRLDLGAGGLLNIEYHLGMDGMSVLMVLLTAVVMPIAVLASWRVERRAKAYFALLLLLNLSLIGCFVALDFFLFYLFFEFMLLPMFFLIGVWGGPRREYAAVKFFLYTLFGSVFMLLVMAGLAFSHLDPDLGQALGREVHTLDLLHMLPDATGLQPNLVPGSVFDHGSVLLGLDARNLAFLVLFIGFAIKLPSVPVHTWLPDAHVEASTPVSVILAAVLLKVGGYGILRIAYGLFPEAGASNALFVGLLGVVSILYGALVAMSQRDLKSLIAYSSVSHMGFVLLGFASMDAVGVSGAVYQMFNHGIISAALFLVAGVVYDRTHDRMIAHYSGLWGVMPRYTAVVLVAFFASMGLPGLNGFVSEMMVLAGAFRSGGGLLPPWVAGLAVLGIVLAAVYYLRTFRQMFFGEFRHEGGADAATLRDLDLREGLLLLPLCAAMVLLGLFPSLATSLIDGPLAAFTERLTAAARP